MKPWQGAAAVNFKLAIGEQDSRDVKDRETPSRRGQP